ncbi:hypothetical protein Tco_1195584 [Tanacetum coccineum]
MSRPLRCIEFEFVVLVRINFLLKTIYCQSNPIPLLILWSSLSKPLATTLHGSDSLVDETRHPHSFSFNDSLPDYESFCFDIDHHEEKSSSNTTSRSDHSLPDYEAFSFDVDHIKEKSSGSTTIHSDFALPNMIRYL